MTVNKSIVMTVIALLVLSVFSTLVIAKERKNPRDNAGTQSVAPVTVSQPVEHGNVRYDMGSINSCHDVKLKRGDSAVFSLDGSKYSMKEGLTGNRYAQLSFQDNNYRFYEGDAKRFDLNSNGKDDLQIAVYELFSGNAFISVCGL